MGARASLLGLLVCACASGAAWSGQSPAPTAFGVTTGQIVRPDGSYAVVANAGRVGTAESAAKGWPYPEPAVRGATGFSPDYSLYTRQSERWDIYIHILWRKANTRSKDQLGYYNYELTQFLEQLPATDARKLKSANHLLLLVEQIRAGTLPLPHRDDITGCLFFKVNHNGRIDLAADGCESGS